MLEEMQRIYVEEHDGKGRVVDYKFYHRVFLERFNLKFQKNKKDNCDKCEAFNNTPVDQRTADAIEEHDQHIDEKELARDFKSKMKVEGEKEGVVSAAFDLEKVLLVPHGPTSSFYYSKRLKVHNFTVTDITTMKTHCFVWHEGEAGKGSSEIGTCLTKYIRQVEAKKVNLFSDRCGGQNNNRMVAIALHDEFIRQPSLEELSMNFLVTGHSQNENDTAHSNIEKFSRKRSLYTPSEWKSAMQFSFKPGKAVINALKTEDVINFKDHEGFPEYLSILKDTTMENDVILKNRKDGKVYWSKIMQYKFVRSKPDKLFFKYHYGSPDYKFTTIYKKLTTRSNKVPKRCNLYDTPLGVQASKKAALLKLCDQVLIPQDHWDFFKNLIRSKDDDSDNCSDEE